MLKKITSLIMLTAIAAFFIISCGGDNQAEQTTENPSAETAAIESDFLFTAYDTDGTLRNSAEWVGKKPVVLNFWGTWCPPCRKEIPDLVKVYNELHPRGIEIIGLAVRDQSDNVIQFAKENGMNWVMLMADNSLAMRYQITGVPTTIFVSREGKELGRFVGPRDYQTFMDAFLLTLHSYPDSTSQTPSNEG